MTPVFGEIVGWEFLLVLAVILLLIYLIWLAIY